ncbi:MAG: FliI/YscN family ATPase [Planctomycetaceae bacterium]|nr:MAG: FliI/YscN family ATPase [Planctomycetaceae bacterium]
MMLKPPSLPTADVIRQRLDATCPLAIRGRVAAVLGGNVIVEGMTVPLGAVLRIELARGRSCDAQVIGFQGTRPVLAPLGEEAAFSAGDVVTLVDQGLRIPVGFRLMGQVLDALGCPLDGREVGRGATALAGDSRAPASWSRPPIDQPVSTGVRAIDAMLTVGRGQRMGIFAGSGVGKSSLLGMLARGTGADAIVVAMVGERGREVRDFVERALGPDGMARCVLVVATSDQPAALRVQAAWTATAIAESMRDEGGHVLLLVDSITRMAMAQRELSLAAGEPVTSRGYTPGVFAALPRLVERAGRSETGSITAFYSVLVEGDDLNEPIADTMRGLLDGHIVLSRALAEEAHWPAIDILESVSRLQPHLVRPEVADAAESLRRDLAEYRRHADLISIGAYRAGSQPSVDRAIAIRDAAGGLLRQRTDQRFTLDAAQQDLLSLVQSVP